MRIKFGAATKDVPILDVKSGEYNVTTDNYIVPKGEEDTYHCIIEQKQFNPTSGKRISKPRIQKFDAKMFPSLIRNLRQQGWDVEIIHDPTEFLREREAKRREMQEMTYQQRQEAEKKRKAAEREALKKELLAELKAMGMLKTSAQKEQKADGSKKK